MEYNSVSWMGAAPSHLHKLDRVQRIAQRIGCFTVTPLQARRETAAMSLALKLLDSQGRGELMHFTPVLTEPFRRCKKRTRQSIEGIQIARRIKSSSLDVYRRSFMGVLPQIWAKIPIEIIERGNEKGWLKIKRDCSDFLTGKTESKNQRNKR